MAEAARIDLAGSIAAAERAAARHPEFSSFKKVVPAAAALAMATVLPGQPLAPRRASGPAVTQQAAEPARPAESPPPQG